ncbi:peptide chain release factor aRF-1 [Candidatus Woesearchaeota archaeon]|nr:peptide chain release factor aRF-1 [Candidatus Woesearchaeota archaeon]
MAISAQDKLKVKKLIRELKTHRAPHTELVSVYVPAGYELTKITQHLGEELGTAANIKSATTRKNVQGALEKMITHLRQYPRTPEKGLVAFSGNIAAAEGKTDFRSWAVEPPMPLNTRIYRCDKMFVTDILEEMLLDHHVYGLVVLDNRDATLALLKGKTFTILQKTHSEVPGKMRAGGQSAHRFDQNRKNAIVQHYKKICEYMKEQFLSLGNNLKGIIIGGPGVTINDFLNHEYLTGDLQKKVLGTKDLSYTDEFGVQELVDKCDDLLSEEAIADEKKAMNEFFMVFRDNPKKITYGEKETLRALEMNAVDVLLLSEALPEEMVFSLSEKAELGGTTVRVISTETREGVQLRDLGGIAAILRFEIEQG